jgi:hypothetical protein
MRRDAPTVSVQLEELARIVIPGLGAVALAGPLLQAISYRAHAERGMIAVAIIATLIGVFARRATRRVHAAAVSSVVFMGSCYLLTLAAYDAVGSFRLRYSMISALCVASALAPLYFASARGRRGEGPGSIEGGAWLLSIAAGAVPESWWVKKQVISIYTLVAVLAAAVGLALVVVGLGRGDPRPSLRQLAIFAVAAAIAHLGVSAVFSATS